MRVTPAIKPILLVTYATLLLVMGAATFVEQRHGAHFAAARIYGTPWFAVLWALLAAGGAVALASARTLRRQRALLLLHAAFLVILSGAGLSYLTGREGTLHLREGDAATAFTDNAGGQARLPFTLRLDSFRVRCHPATGAPADFVSYVRHDDTATRVSMNRILRVGGYRLFQKSFDADGHGTTLGVTCDPWGIGVTYAGYALLLAAILARLFGKMKWRKGLTKRALPLLLLLPVCGVPACALYAIGADEGARSAASIGAELLYNRLQFAGGLFVADIALGFFVLACALFRPKRPASSAEACTASLRRTGLCRRLRTGWGGVLVLLLLLHLVPWLLRWVAGGHVPMANGSETMQFLAICALAFAVGTGRGKVSGDPGVAFALLLAGFAMLVSHPGEASPQFGPLMPVLSSPLLGLHVSVIMLSYTLLAFTFLGSVAVLLAPQRMAAADRMVRRVLEPAVLLLAVGIFIGAVWANVSWGRYWSWDPKEVWALITLMVYALPLHAAALPAFRRRRFLHAYLLVAFLTLLMTYFGVNCILGGLHSYA